MRSRPFISAGMACATTGAMLTIEGRLPASMSTAQVRVTLERPFTSVPDDLEPLPSDPLEKAKVMTANHERSQRVVLAENDQKASAGVFQARLLIPSAWAGDVNR